MILPVLWGAPREFCRWGCSHTKTMLMRSTDYMKSQSRLHYGLYCSKVLCTHWYFMIQDIKHPQGHYIQLELIWTLRTSYCEIFVIYILTLLLFLNYVFFLSFFKFYFCSLFGKLYILSF